MKRSFDLVISLTAFVICIPLFIAIAALVKITSDGPVLHWSNRVGRYNKIFKMPKFRTMQVGTPTVATHLLVNPEQFLTPMGSFLRITSLDELPQLWNIIIGDMSIVGPRPALFNQNDLILLRLHHGIDKLTPGLTGWAQVNGRDELSIEKKVLYEFEYLQKKSLYFDIKIIGLTFIKILKRSGISH